MSAVADAGKVDWTSLMGAPLAPLTEERARTHVVASAAVGEGGSVVFVNTDVLRQLCRRAELRMTVEAASLVLADGMPIVWLSRVIGTRVPERVAGSDFVYTLSAAAACRGLSIFLLGGEPGVAEAAAARLETLTPGLRVAGVMCPPHGFESSEAELAAIERAVCAGRPAIVFVALGFPKQERLIARLRPVLPEAWFVSSGASLTFVAGRISRAPAWMQEHGLEWLHRLVHEPRRLFRRYVVEDAPFLLGLAVRAFLGRARADAATVERSSGREMAG